MNKTFNAAKILDVCGVCKLSMINLFFFLLFQNICTESIAKCMSMSPVFEEVNVFSLR